MSANEEGPAAGRSGTNLLADIATHLPKPDCLDDIEAAAARFDVSPYRLWLLFQTVDENRDGFISKTELVRALSSASNPNDQDSNVNTGALSHISEAAHFHEEHQEFVADIHREEDEEDAQDDGDEVAEDTLSLADIQALDDLWDRVALSATNPAASDEQQDEEKTQEHRNYPESEAGIAFPQFCRVIRYMWLQQLMNPGLDNPNDPNSHYHFECVDYASGYYRHAKIPGNVSQKKSRGFFTAPRYGHASMRWIDVPSGTFEPSAKVRKEDSQTYYQAESFRTTILRLAVKYRFHPTSIEDAIDLVYQEPKVNSFEHSLLDLGNYNCGTISWIRHAGHGEDSLREQKNLGQWSFHPDQTPSMSSPPVPTPKPAARMSSTQSFSSYHKEGDAIPDFIMTEGGDDINKEEGRHYFITIPMFELSRRSQTSLDLYNEAAELMPVMQIQPLIIEVNEATLGLFVASQPEANLVVTCSTKWRATRIKPFSFRNNNNANARQYKANSRTRHGSPNNKDNKDPLDSDAGVFHDFEEVVDSDSDSDGDDIIQGILQDEKMSLERVKDLLRKRHSIQRHRNSNWLMHAIIDAVVDHLAPISKIYEAQLQRMSTRLFELQHRLSRSEVKEMIVMKRNLEWLVRELGPFARVIRHLIDDTNIGVEVTHYLEDVEDHLLRTVEELSSYASECVSLKDEYNAYLDRRMNDILYVLTLVTTLIVPAQFFTGYYGMNFEDEDGLGDPLLRKGSTGLAIFWGMTFGATAIVVFIMHRCNFFERRERD